MNLSKQLLSPAKFLFGFALKCRKLLPCQQSKTFGSSTECQTEYIGQIYVINLDRQHERWIDMRRELSQVLDSTKVELIDRTVRYSAIDARSFEQPLIQSGEIIPFYTLGDQLFVEPQPHALPDRLSLDRSIQMSQPEVAVARSHIGVWRKIAAGEDAYALVLEDDIWFQWGFARHLDQAWAEMNVVIGNNHLFDILYLSYEEVKHGAQKTFLSPNVFCPVRGLWHLSGYVLSREGAAKLLDLLPCRGPVDLWINHQFEKLEVRATRRSIISQRRDKISTNSYSILPVLTKIGVLDDGGDSLFRLRPLERPIFAFGSNESGLSSLAMALSMLGYKCCSDLLDLPETEFKCLVEGRQDRVFDAYVNIKSLEVLAEILGQQFKQAKFIVTTNPNRTLESKKLDILDSLSGRSVVILPVDADNEWKIVCEHLRCPPPACPFPKVCDLGQRPILHANLEGGPAAVGKDAKRDISPWVVGSECGWAGIRSNTVALPPPIQSTLVATRTQLDKIDTKRWLLRDDTFASNLALFRPSNIELLAGTGAILSVKKEALGVREYSAASISSRDSFLYGKFEIEMRPAKVSGIVTGFFLHRNLPRLEIDVEIVGRRSNYLLVNVFYNPGEEGANFDYGYRGTPRWIELGFDASKLFHRYAIEWSPDQIRWLVDGNLVHERVNWNPTPIPQLPMTLHVNTWPTRSRELAGRLAVRRLPSTVVVRSITVEANAFVDEDLSDFG